MKGCCFELFFLDIDIQYFKTFAHLFDDVRTLALPPFLCFLERFEEKGGSFRFCLFYLE